MFVPVIVPDAWTVGPRDSFDRRVKNDVYHFLYLKVRD